MAPQCPDRQTVVSSLKYQVSFGERRLSSMKIGIKEESAGDTHKV